MSNNLLKKIKLIKNDEQTISQSDIIYKDKDSSNEMGYLPIYGFGKEREKTWIVPLSEKQLQKLINQQIVMPLLVKSMINICSKALFLFSIIMIIVAFFVNLPILSFPFIFSALFFFLLYRYSKQLNVKNK